MNKMKMNKRYVKSALKIFVLSVMVIVVVHSVFEGHGLHLEYTLSRYVGLDYWSWIAFATCNVVVCELAFKYLAGVKNEWGMSLGWWISALWMLMMLLGLSFFPIGLFDEAWGDYGTISQIHRVTAWLMFALAVVTIVITLTKFKEEKMLCNFGFFMVIYGILLGGSIFLGIELIENLSLLVEWGFIVMYLAFLFYIPDFEPEKESQVS